MSSIGQIVDLPMVKVYADSDFNCRGAISPFDVIDLARDIASHGLRNPIIVHPMDDGRFRIVAGHRRHAAHKVNKAQSIPAIIRTYKSELEARAENLKENLIRKQLNIVQESKAIAPFVNAGWTEKMIADEFQQSNGWVHIRKILLMLSPEIQQEAAAGFLTQEQIRLISLMPQDKRHDKVLEIKNAKLRGERIKLDKPKRKVNILKPVVPTKTEIEALIAELGDIMGMGFHTRLLAWAAGNISRYELNRSLKEYCEQEGYEYHMPAIPAVGE